MIFKGPPAQMRRRAKTPVFLTKHSTIMTKKNWVDHRQSQTCLLIHMDKVDKDKMDKEFLVLSRGPF